MIANDIFYESVGAGLPIVFVHGLGGTSNVWHAQRQTLQKFYQVVTLDLPGSGRSARSSSYSMERWAEQIVGLADHLGLPQFVIVGHSMATILAQILAGEYPERIKAAVLCGPLTELPSAAKEIFKTRAVDVGREGMMSVADAVLSGALTLATREANPALTGLCRELLLSNDPTSYAAQCLALVAGSAKSAQPKIKCPVLILEGDQDAVTPLANCKAIAAAVPQARTRLVPATAHLTMLERPDWFNAYLSEFLATLD